MDKDEYKNEKIYKDSVELIRAFCEALQLNDAKDLANFNYEVPLFWNKRFAKYRKINLGDSYDPDNMRITKAIYICLWGYIFDIKDIDDVGAYGRIKRKFRGDTMSSFNILGSSTDLDQEIKNKFKSKYHQIGNFIIIPNYGNVNSQKGATKPKEFVQDSFELFLYALSEHKRGNKNLISHISDDQNHGLYFTEDNDCIYFKNKEEFFISDYFDNNNPKRYYNNNLKEWAETTISFIESRSLVMAGMLFDAING